MRHVVAAVVVFAACRPVSVVGHAEIVGIDQTTIGETEGKGSTVVVVPEVVAPDAPLVVVPPPAEAAPPSVVLVDPMLGFERAGTALRVVANGDAAYVALGYGGIAAIDVPLAHVVTTMKDDAYIADLVFANDVLYAATSDGVIAFGVASPYVPSSVVRSPVFDARNVQLAGGKVYASNGGIEILELDPATLQVVGGGPDISNDAFVQDGAFTYVAFETKLFVYEDYEQLGYGPAYIDGKYKSCLTLAGSLLFACSEDEVQVFDVSDPNDVTLVASLPALGLANEVRVSGGVASVSDLAGGLLQYDASTLSLVGSWTGGAVASAVSTAGVIVASDPGAGVRVIDAGEETARVGFGPIAIDAQIIDGALVIADPTAGVFVLDAETRDLVAQPSVVVAYGLLADADRLYVTTELATIVLERSTWETIGSLPVGQLTIMDGVIYIASGETEVLAFDCDTFEPLASRHFAFAVNTTVAFGGELIAAASFDRLMVAGDLLIAPADGGVSALHIADLSLAWFAPLSTPAGFLPGVVIGDRVYVAAGDELTVLDVADGAVVASVALAGGMTWAIAAHGPYLIVSAGMDGFEVLDSRDL